MRVRVFLFSFCAVFVGACSGPGSTPPPSPASPALLESGDVIANPQTIDPYTYVAYSPDGELIAWIGAPAPERGSFGSLVIARPDGSKRRAVELGIADGLGIAFSPDGETVVAIAASGDSGEKRLALVDTSTLAFTTPIPEDADRPRFSPDGEAIAYVREGASGATLIVRELEDTAELVSRAFPGSEPYQLSYAFSPDGSELAATDGAGELVLIPVAGTDGDALGVERTVTIEPADTVIGWNRDGVVVWGREFALLEPGNDELEPYLSGLTSRLGAALDPEGELVAVAHDLTPQEDTELAHAQLVFARADGRIVSRWQAPDGLEPWRYFAFSPDASRLLALVYRPGRPVTDEDGHRAVEGEGEAQIWMVESESGLAKRIR